MSPPVLSHYRAVCSSCTGLDARQHGGSRQQTAGTRSESGEGAGTMTSIVDRRPSWPLAARSYRKEVSSTAGSSSTTRQQRPWTAIRQPGISMAPSLAPASCGAANGQGTAPAEARPPERQLQTQPQQSGHQPARLPSPDPSLAKHGAEQISREDLTSAEAEPEVEAISRQTPKPPQDGQADQGSSDPRAASRTSLAQHIAAHGPPKLIFFDLETTGAEPSCWMRFGNGSFDIFCAHGAVWLCRSWYCQGKDCGGRCYGPRNGRTVFDAGQPQRGRYPGGSIPRARHLHAGGRARKCPDIQVQHRLAHVSNIQ